MNIQVGDVNDNAPTFHNQPYSVRIPEVGTWICLGEIPSLNDLFPLPLSAKFVFLFQYKRNRPVYTAM